MIVRLCGNGNLKEWKMGKKNKKYHKQSEVMCSQA